MEFKRNFHKRLRIEAINRGEARATRSLCKHMIALESEPMMPEPSEFQPNASSDVNSVPIDCLYIVFQKIPLIQLIPLRAVCHYWKEIVEAICRWTRTVKIRLHDDEQCSWPCKNYVPCSLKAIYSFDDLAQYLDEKKQHQTDFSMLRIDQNMATAATRNQLRFLFPNATNLTFCYTMEYKPRFIAKMALLTTAFPATTKLAIWTMMVGQPPANHSIGRLCNVINVNLLKLTSLDLFIEDLYNHKNRSANAHFSINLSQILPTLKRFNLSCSVKNHMDVLRELSDNLTELSINCQFIKIEDIRPVLEEKAKMCANVRHLRLTYVSSGALIAEMCRHFHAIESLQVAYVTIKSVSRDISRARYVSLPLVVNTTFSFLSFSSGNHRLQTSHNSGRLAEPQLCSFSRFRL